MFTTGSRYADLPVLQYPLPDGRIVRYVARRLLPDPDGLTTIAIHVVRDGERLDQVAAAELGDPEQAWRVADAHRVLDPAELTAEAGTRLRITLPAGLPAGVAMGVPGA
jgi:hypothetical protein